jgi:hypothetical protein
LSSSLRYMDADCCRTGCSSDGTRGAQTASWQVYLDAKTDTYLEEVSSCNVFVVKGRTIKTPPLQVRSARASVCALTFLTVPLRQLATHAICWPATSLSQSIRSEDQTLMSAARTFPTCLCACTELDHNPA